MPHNKINAHFLKMHAQIILNAPIYNIIYHEKGNSKAKGKNNLLKGTEKQALSVPCAFMRILKYYCVRAVSILRLFY